MKRGVLISRFSWVGVLGFMAVSLTGVFYQQVATAADGITGTNPPSQEAQSVAPSNPAVPQPARLIGKVEVIKNADGSVSQPTFHAVDGTVYRIKADEVGKQLAMIPPNKAVKLLAFVSDDSTNGVSVLTLAVKKFVIITPKQPRTEPLPVQSAK